MSDRSVRSGDQDEESLRVLAEAMEHPIRGQLLQAVSEKSDQGGVTIRQLSERLGEPKRRVRYHLDALEGLGFVGVAAERSTGGHIERFYRIEQVPFLRQELADRDQARRVAIEVVKAVLTDASSGIRTKVFGVRPGHALIRVNGDVDHRGWSELSDLQKRVLPEVQTILSAARERLDRSEEETISAVVALFLFEVPPWSLAKSSR